MNYNQLGKKNPNYKHGESTYQHFCKDCDKKISWKSIRCNKCFHKTQIKVHTYNCKCCNKKISKGALSGICKSCINRRHWNNKNYANRMRKKLLKALLKSPNKKEKYLIQVLPKEYRFVGNGQVIIEGFNPDFINFKKKKIIELYGDYWHNRKEIKERDKRKKLVYSRCGYKVLVIWEHELRNINKLKEKISKYIKKVA